MFNANMRERLPVIECWRLPVYTSFCFGGVRGVVLFCFIASWFHATLSEWPRGVTSAMVSDDVTIHTVVSAGIMNMPLLYEHEDAVTLSCLARRHRWQVIVTLNANGAGRHAWQRYVLAAIRYAVGDGHR